MTAETLALWGPLVSKPEALTLFQQENHINKEVSSLAYTKTAFWKPLCSCSSGKSSREYTLVQVQEWARSLKNQSRSANVGNKSQYETITATTGHLSSESCKPYRSVKTCFLTHQRKHQSSPIVNQTNKQNLPWGSLCNTEITCVSTRIPNTPKGSVSP